MKSIQEDRITKKAKVAEVTKKKSNISPAFMTVEIKNIEKKNDWTFFRYAPVIVVSLTSSLSVG